MMSLVFFITRVSYYVYDAKLRDSLNTIPSKIDFDRQILKRTPSHNF